MRLIAGTLFISSALALYSCGKPQTTAPPQQAAAPAASATPAATPTVSASLQTAAAPSPPKTIAGKPVFTPPPVAPSAPTGQQAKPLPPALMEKLTRPLTLEEINKLPPNVRDMILRAQGRLPASPSATPKKN